MSSKDNRVLRKFFDYISLSIHPNIDVYTVRNTDTILGNYTPTTFHVNDVETCMKSHKSNGVYYAVLKLKNSTYMYLTGHVTFNSDHFELYIASSLKELLPFIHISLLPSGL